MALDTFEGLEKFEGSDYLANIAISLSQWHEKDENIEEALKNLKKAEKIFEDNYSVVDKRTCKVKREISLLHLK